jgi:hypothetical protein
MDHWPPDDKGPRAAVMAGKLLRQYQLAQAPRSLCRDVHARRLPCRIPKRLPVFTAMKPQLQLDRVRSKRLLGAWVNSNDRERLS